MNNLFRQEGRRHTVFFVGPLKVLHCWGAIFIDVNIQSVVTYICYCCCCCYCCQGSWVLCTAHESCPTLAGGVVGGGGGGAKGDFACTHDSACHVIAVDRYRRKGLNIVGTEAIRWVVLAGTGSVSLGTYVVDYMNVPPAKKRFAMWIKLSSTSQGWSDAVRAFLAGLDDAINYRRGTVTFLFARTRQQRV